MYFFDPVAPVITWQHSIIYEMAFILGQVAITPYGSNTVTASNSKGIKMFVGPREDSFFMDFARYREILAGDAAGFENPRADTFAGFNVLAVAIEVSKRLIGSSGTIATWVE
jgi:hypothetical protein